MQPGAPEQDWIESWLTPDRFRKYVRAAGGDRRRALRIYEWNLKLGGALLRDLGHLEIALRNAYDRTLADHPRARGDWLQAYDELFPPHWVREDGRRKDKNKTPRGNLKGAWNRVGDDAPRGKVIAELTFGFWTYLTDDLHEKTLWVPALHRAFREGVDRPRVHDALTVLRDVRNRAAHHESVFDRDPAGAHRRVLYVARLVSGELSHHIRETSEVESLRRSKP